MYMKNVRQNNIMVGEISIWHTISLGLKYAVGPLAILFWWVFRKQDSKVENIENRIKLIEIETAVMKSQIQDMKDDIGEIKYGVREIVQELRNNRHGSTD